MGRIKSTMVKKAAKQLLATTPSGTFTTAFEHDKRALANTMPSKSTRNKVAGYIARLVIMRQREKEKTAAPLAPLVETPSEAV